MGPVRQRQLIRLLSWLVAFNLVTGVVAIYANTGSTPAAASAAQRVSDGHIGADGPDGSPTTPGSAMRPTTSDGTVVVDDSVDDTNVDGTNEVKPEPRADIIRARATNRPASVTLSLQFRQPVDPKTDSRWSSESTFLAWEIDTNDDGAVDYEAQFVVADGDYGGTVTKPGDTSEDPLCDAVAGYGPDSGYTLVIESGCLGDPASFSYRAGMYYDTDPKDPNADVIFDATPNGGFSFPVGRRP